MYLPSARTAVGVALGLLLGGLGGYYISKAACDWCDEAGPLWIGAAVGGAVGAGLGGVAGRSYEAPSRVINTPVKRALGPGRPNQPGLLTLIESPVSEQHDTRDVRRFSTRIT